MALSVSHGEWQPDPERPASRRVWLLPVKVEAGDQLHAFIARHVVARDLRPGTEAHYREQVRPVVRFCAEAGIARLEEWTPEDGLDFVRWLSAQRCAPGNGQATTSSSRPWKPRRVNMVLTLVKLYFRHKIETGEMASSPLAGVRNRKEEIDTDPIYLTGAQLSALLRTCDRSKGLSCRDYILVAFCACLGLRPSEVCRIKRSDLQGNRIVVPSAASKTRESRTCYLPEDPQRRGQLAAALRKPLADYLLWRSTRVQEHDGDGRLFVNRLGRALTPAALRQVCSALAEAAGMDPKLVTIYRLRHTAAVKVLRESGWNLETTRRLLGHKGYAMVIRYTRLRDEDLLEEFRKWDMFSGVELPTETVQKERKPSLADIKRKQKAHGIADGEVADLLMGRPRNARGDGD
jgi:site-specific recombinase XerD